MQQLDSKQLRWYNIATMGFIAVWGFGNVVNNYANQGLSVIVSWVLIISLYFIPYALMVGELGSAFKTGKAGVSSWVEGVSSPLIAYLAGWTYWVVHVPYLAQKPQSALVAFSWAIFQNGSLMDRFSTLTTQLIILAIFLVFVWLASKGITSIKRLSNVAGTAMFIMGMLYVVMMVAAPAIRDIDIATKDWSFSSIMPKFDFAYFTTVSMLVFAVGGCEKLSPYVNDTNNPDKEFPKGMIVLAIGVAISAMLGSIAMGMMFDSANRPEDLMMNGAYYAFQLLGQYYGLGNFFVIVYALTNMICQLSVLLISIDAPLKVLLFAETNSKFIPKSLTKVNKHGAPINGYKMTTVLVSALIIIPALGIGNMNELYTWLLKLNSVVMPLRYLWVFFAYMGLKRMSEKYNAEYKFIKNNKFGFVAGLWCFAFTAFACILGMFPGDIPAFTPDWNFRVGLNFITIVILIGLGCILPAVAKKTNKAEEGKYVTQE